MLERRWLQRWAVVGGGVDEVECGRTSKKLVNVGICECFMLSCGEVKGNNWIQVVRDGGIIGSEDGTKVSNGCIAQQD